MSFDDSNFDSTDEEQLPEESGNNRTFLIAVGILGGIILISVACIAGIFLFSRNNQAAQQAQIDGATQTAAASNNFINQALTSTAQAQIQVGWLATQSDMLADDWGLEFKAPY